MSLKQVQAFRLQKDTYFEGDARSPLSPGQKAAFDGLDYYEYEPTLDLTVTVDRHDDDNVAQVFTTKDTIRNYQRYGHFSFEVDGHPVKLTIYQTAHGFFLPFVDAGAGEETYPAGRYIDPHQINETTFHVDFNVAYNPFCAYSDRFECPITPDENRLDVAIRAGEKLPSGEWVELK